MSEKQVSKMIGILVEHQGYFEQMSTEDLQWVIQHPKEAIAIFIWAVVPYTKQKRTILRFHEEIAVNPLAERFVPTEFFRDREGLYLWSNMQRVLKNAKVVEPTGTVATKLRAFDLIRNAYDKEIK